MLFAERGHLRRTMQRVDGIHRVGQASVIHEFDVEFKDIESNLGDARYAELTDMDVPAGASVNDRINNRRYTKDSGGR